jgi:hypothetical protein
MITPWIVASIVAVAALLFSFRGRNAVWGGLTLGLIGGVIAAIIYYARGKGFLWITVGKWVVVCVLLGVAAEALGALADRAKKR